VARGCGFPVIGRREHGESGAAAQEPAVLTAGTWTKVAASYSLPRNSRYGIVLPIAQAEYDRLLTAYLPNRLGTSVDPSR